MYNFNVFFDNLKEQFRKFRNPGHTIFVLHIRMSDYRAVGTSDQIPSIIQ